MVQVNCDMQSERVHADTCASHSWKVQNGTFNSPVIFDYCCYEWEDATVWIARAICVSARKWAFFMRQRKSAARKESSGACGEKKVHVREKKKAGARNIYKKKEWKIHVRMSCPWFSPHMLIRIYMSNAVKILEVNKEEKIGSNKWVERRETNSSRKEKRRGAKRNKHTTKRGWAIEWGEREEK